MNLERRASTPKAHVIPLISGILFLEIVVGLKLAVSIDPDGGITDTAPFLLTLPWSLFAPRIGSRWWALAATLFFAAINAMLLYLVVRGSLKVVSPRITLAVLVPIALLVSAAVWLLNLVEHDYPIRIVTGGQENGIWLATDSDGLRAMDGVNSVGSDLPPEMRRHFIFVPNKTRGISITGGGYLLQDGQLVDPYPTTLSEMKRDHVTDVEKIRITEGPSKGIEGWADIRKIQHKLVMP